MQGRLLKYLLAAMAVCSILAGCSSGNREASGGPSFQPAAAAGSPSPQPAVSTEKPEEQKPDSDLPGGGEEMEEPGESELFTDKLLNVFLYAGNGELLYFDEHKVELIDMVSLEVLKSAEYGDLGFHFFESEMIDRQVHRTEQGYKVTGYLVKQHTLQMVEFDRDLKVVQNVELGIKCKANVPMMGYCLFEDQQKVIYSTRKGLFLHDLKEGTSASLYDGFVSSFCYLENSGQVLLEMEKSKKSVLMRLKPEKGQGLEEKWKVEEEWESENSWHGLQAFGSFAIVKKNGESMTSNRTLHRYDPENGLQDFPPLQEEMEDKMIRFSFGGEYFTTSLRDADKSYRIKVYSLKNGELLSEQLFDSETFGEKFNPYRIWICEEKKRFVLAVEGWKDHEEGIWLMSRPLSSILK